MPKPATVSDAAVLARMVELESSGIVASRRNVAIPISHARIGRLRAIGIARCILPISSAKRDPTMYRARRSGYVPIETKPEPAIISIPIRSPGPATIPIPITRPKTSTAWEDKEIRRAKTVQRHLDRLEAVRKLEAEDRALQRDRATAARRFHERTPTS